mgnify:CR=1 FL=1
MNKRYLKYNKQVCMTKDCQTNWLNNRRKCKEEQDLYQGYCNWNKSYRNPSIQGKQFQSNTLDRHKIHFQKPTRVLSIYQQICEVFWKVPLRRSHVVFAFKKIKWSLQHILLYNWRNNVCCSYGKSNISLWLPKLQITSVYSDKHRLILIPKNSNHRVLTQIHRI